MKKILRLLFGIKKNEKSEYDIINKPFIVKACLGEENCDEVEINGVLFKENEKIAVKYKLDINKWGVVTLVYREDVNESQGWCAVDYFNNILPIDKLESIKKIKK